MAYAPVHDYGFDPSSTFAFPVERTQYPLDQQEHVVSPESQSFSARKGQKRYADIDLQEVNPYWATPGAAMPSAPTSHQRGWSDSTISIEEESGTGKKKGASTSASSFIKKPALFRAGRSWSFEIISILVSWAAVGAIMGVLARYNGRALPEWPYYITLNAVIALLATVATASMSISLQNGLSQLKWIRFKESRAPLADMEAFDEASRGTWGAMKLLVKARGGFLGSFGAIVAIVALALSPFAQQVVTYQTRSVENLQGASINRALNYTGALPGNTSSTGFVPLLPLKSAVYNGLFAENGRPGAALAFECQSGNCTWDAYETLGVCHECVDLTPFISQYCATPTTDNDDCGWQVPQNGARLSTGAEVFGMTSHVPAARGDMPHSTIVQLVFIGTEAHDGLAGEKRPWARQCVLSACVQTLESTVSNGVLEEKVVDSYVNKTVLDISVPEENGLDRNVYVANPRSNTTTTTEYYILGIEALLAMRGWFSSIFAAGSALRSPTSFNRTITNSTVVVNLTVGIASGETFFDSDVVTAFYWNYYEYADGLDMLMRDTATSMTVAFRGFVGGEAVHGRATTAESYVYVRWGFAVLPILVVAGAALFLGAAMHCTQKSGTEPWKSSALAPLLHGLGADTRAQFGQAGNLSEQKRQAKGVKVQLGKSDDGQILLKA
ncbi:hypothetical protein F4677DRAFT_372677 [Hypoxylon crocopeplum]|nr:hypothetical protein F4677DRAFT_372677 [Hypoxylon crocopeplum]